MSKSICRLSKLDWRAFPVAPSNISLSSKHGDTLPTKYSETLRSFSFPVMRTHVHATGTPRLLRGEGSRKEAEKAPEKQLASLLHYALRYGIAADCPASRTMSHVNPSASQRSTGESRHIPSRKLHPVPDPSRTSWWRNKLAGPYSQNGRAPPYPTSPTTMRQTNPRIYPWWHIGAGNTSRDKSGKGESGVVEK